MLVTNQRLDKLAAARVDFKSRGMLNGTCLLMTLQASCELYVHCYIGSQACLSALVAIQQHDSHEIEEPDANQLNESNATGSSIGVTEQADNEDVEIDNGPTAVEAHVQLAKTFRKNVFIFCIECFSNGTSTQCTERKRARTIPELSAELSIASLPILLRRFLFEQLSPDDPRTPFDIPLAECPRFDGKIQVFNSASSTFYAPSDRSGIGGMRREHIRACPLWRNEAPRNDCVFVNTDAGVQGMADMDIARILCFFSFTFETVLFSCAVIHWFDKTTDKPDEDTGMWTVKPSFNADRSSVFGIIHIDSIYRAAHLIPIYGTQTIPRELKHYNSYDAFRTFYVNRFADHHAFEIAS